MTEDLRKAALAALDARKALLETTYFRLSVARDAHRAAMDAFCALANPAAILALLDERDAAIARAEKAVGERDEARADHEWMRNKRNEWQDATTVARRRAEAAEASLAAVTAERDAMREVYDAARGLCIGVDWNKGTHAIERGYRKRLIEAVNAVEATNAPPKTAQELNPDTLRYGNKRFKRKEPTNAK